MHLTQKGYQCLKLGHKADRAAPGMSCGVCFEALACVFASADACKEYIRVRRY